MHSYNTQIFPLDDADEWRYTACSRLVGHGYALFTQVFSAQPPLLFLSLAGGMHVFGDSITGARVVEIAFGALALGSVAWIAWMLSGPVGAGAAAVLLAASPLFLIYSRAVEAEGPMMALVTLGLALALAYNRSGRWALCLVAGLAIAAAVLFKLFAFAALAPALWIVVARNAPIRNRIVAGAIVLAATVVPVALEMALVAPSDQWNQVISLHSSAAALNLPNALSNVDILRDVFTLDIGLTLLALAGLVALFMAAMSSRSPAGFRRIFGWARSPAPKDPGASVPAESGPWHDLVFLLLWLGGFTGMLALFHPLFPHHAAILLTALATPAGAGIGLTWQSVKNGTWEVAALPALALLAYAVTVPRLAHDGRHALIAWNGTMVDPLAAYVQANTAPADMIATDNLAVADIAHRLVPPGLCDPSNVRLLAGYLSAHTLIQQTRTYHARIVVPAGNFLQVPAYIAWVRSHYRAARGPGGTTLYERR